MTTHRVCSTPGCPTIHPGTGKCPQCKRKAEHKRRPNGNPYKTPGHKAFRKQVLQKHPHCTCTGWCQRHTPHKCPNKSTVADHHPKERATLKAEGQNPNDPQHGRGLCTTCHNSKTARTRPFGPHQPRNN